MFKQGTVKIGIYIVYIRAVGIFLTVAILLSLTAMQVSEYGNWLLFKTYTIDFSWSFVKLISKRLFIFYFCLFTGT